MTPSTGESVTPARGERNPGEETPTRSTAVRRASVLVVDDDVMIGGIIRRVLSPEYDVTLAINGSEALKLVLAGQRFDALLCDLMMPHMTGMDFFAELARTKPELCERVAFITGGAFTPEARAFLDRIPNRRLDKPFAPENLRALIRELLQLG
jgi:CheY-like chemotaxis protein